MSKDATICEQGKRPSLFIQMHVAFLNLCVYLHQLSTILLLAKLFASNLKSATFEFYFLVCSLKIIRKIIRT